MPKRRIYKTSDYDKNKEQNELIILKIIGIILYIGETMNLKKRGSYHLKKWQVAPQKQICIEV